MSKHSRFKRIIGSASGLTAALASAWLAFSVSNCGKSPDPETGECPRDCSKALEGSSQWKVKLISQEEVSISCAAATAAGRVTARFLVYEEKEQQTSGGSTSASKVQFPKAGVAFVPMIIGGLSASSGAAEFAADPNYGGVVTPRADWCTDSCGVATLTFVPQCPDLEATTTVNAMILSGGAAPEKGMALSLTGK